MEKFRPRIEAEIFLPEEWYLNDDILSDIYLKMESNEISSETINYMFQEVEEKLQALLQIGSDKLSGEQLQQVTMLGNVARELYKHSSHYHVDKSSTKSDVTDLGETVH